MGTEFQVGSDEVLETDGGGGCTTKCMYLMPLNCILQMINFFFL